MSEIPHGTAPAAAGAGVECPHAIDLFAPPPHAQAIFGVEGRPLAAGERLVQKDLAQSFRLIADDGPGVFYAGVIGQAIDAAMRESGGFLTPRDLVDDRAECWEPIRIDYRGHEVVTASPPANAYGSRLMPPGTGIWLNNSLQYCTFEPKGNPMDAHAGRRKLSGDCPTIVMKNGRPWAALGTPGGHTIGQTVPQIVSSTVRTAGPSGSGAPPTRGVGGGRRGTDATGHCLRRCRFLVLGSWCLVRAWCFVPGAESADGLSALTRTRHQALSTHPAPGTPHAPGTKH